MIITSTIPKYTLSTVVTESGIVTTVVKTTQTSQIEGRCWNLDGAPSNLVATVISDEEIDLEFVIGSTNHKLHRIYISTDNVDFTELTTLTGETNTYSVTGLDAQTQYWFYVVAEKDGIVSAPSNTATGTTLTALPNGDCTDLSAAVISDSELALTWVNGSTNEDGISIERSLTGVGTWSVIHQTLPGVETYTNTGLDFDTTYYYRVRAFKGTNYSAYSNTDNAKTSIPFEGDLSLRFVNRANAVYNELLQALNAKILPSCALVDGSNYLSRSVSNFMSTDTTGYVDCRFYYNGTSTPIYLFSSASSLNSTRYFTVQINAGFCRLLVRNSTEFTNIMAYSTPLSTGWHTIRWESNGSVYKFYLNGVEKSVSVSTGSNDGKWIDWVDLRNNISIGYLYSSSPLYSQTAYIDYVDYNGKAKWYFTGKGKYEYDTVGSLNLTWTGSAHIYYDENVSRYYLDNGWMLYKKTGEADEQVPLTATVTDIEALGYTKPDYGDFTGSSTAINMASCMVDFSPTANAMFDRSNVTTNTTISRASSYYNAATPYRWHVSEIADPRKYIEFLTVGNAGKLYSAVETQLSSDGDYYIKSMDQTLLYLTDKTGADMYKVMQYCGTNVFADI